MDDDAALDLRAWIGQVRAVARTDLVVVDNGSRRLIPDPDPEPVWLSRTPFVLVDRCQHESIVAAAVNRSGALVLRPMTTRNHEPLIIGALEVQASGMELKLGVAGRNAGAFVILRDEKEVRPAHGIWEECRGTCRRVDPPAASDEPAIGVVCDHILEGSS